MNHIFGMLFYPHREWGIIASRHDTYIRHILMFLLPVAVIPPASWYFGATSIGWTVGDRVIKLTSDSAMEIMVLFYLSIPIGITLLGLMVHWMSETYEAPASTISKGISIAAYTCTPLFICGLTGLYPLLWLDIILGCAAAAYSVYLLYIGVPIVMNIPKERGFLFASAMVAVGLTGCAALLGATVILWEMGAMPVFSD